jgi:hypothetical protein
MASGEGLGAGAGSAASGASSVSSGDDSPIRCVQRLLFEMEMSDGKEKIRQYVRGGSGLPPFKGIQRLTAAFGARPSI